MWLNENISYKLPSKMIKINPRIPFDMNITNFQKTWYGPTKLHSE